MTRKFHIIEDNVKKYIELMSSDIPNLNLDSLSDVVISYPVDGNFLKYNGIDWINAPLVTPVSAGAGVVLHPCDISSDITDYETLEIIPNGAPEVIETAICNNEKKLIDTYITKETGIGHDNINAGIWTFNIWGKSSVDLGAIIIVDFYKRSVGGTETFLFSMETPLLSSSLVNHVVSVTEIEYSSTPSDRLVVKISGQTSLNQDVTVSFYNQGTEHYSSILTPFVVNHNDLIGLQGGSTNQYYHLSSTQLTNLNNQSGTNTGDETTSTIKSKLGIITLSGSNTGDQDLSGLVPKTTTVNGHSLTGNISVTASDLGLGNVDNTSDINKPISSATQTALNGKENTLTKGNLTEATSSILTISGGSNAVIGSGTSIQVKQSNTSQSGYLSSTDWNTFNNKLSTSLTSASIFVGNGSGIATGVTLSNDATLSNTGALTIANNAITNAKLSQAGSNTYKGNATGSTANVSDIATNTAFNKSFETTASNIKANGTASVGVLDTLARADHVHPNTSVTNKTNIKAINGSTQSIGSSILTKVTFPTISTDTLTEFSSSTFTSKSAQFVMVSSYIEYVVNTMATDRLLTLYIYKNGNQLYKNNLWTPNRSNAYPPGLIISYPVEVATGDTLEIYTIHNDSNSRNLNGNQVVAIIGV